MQSMIDLTDRYPMKFDLARLRNELKQLETSEWVRHYDPTQPGGWTTIPMRSIGGKTDGPDSIRHGPYPEYRNTPILDSVPYMRAVVESFKCPIGRVRLSKMSAGTVLTAHRDIKDEVASIAFRQVRLHVPITTNEQVAFFIGNEKFYMAPGRLYYADFAKVHYVRNDSTEARVHLFLELKLDDWLMSFFPKPSFLDEVDMATQRAFLPLLWKMLGLRYKYGPLFWKAYEGSKVQELRHRMRAWMQSNRRAA